MKRVVSLVAIVATGCGTASKDIAGSYASPMQYNTYSCEQLAAESARIQAHAGQLAGRLDKKANNDKAIVAVSAVLFWPAIFFIGGTREQEAEYGRLKGEHEAVQKASIEKGCGTTTTAAAPALVEPAVVPATADVPPTPSPTDTF